MEALIDIPEDVIKRLDRLSESEHKSRNELLQQALLPFLERREKAHPTPEDRRKFLDLAFGALRGRVEDGQVFQERMRREWDRDLRR